MWRIANGRGRITRPPVANAWQKDKNYDELCAGLELDRRDTKIQLAITDLLRHARIVTDPEKLAYLNAVVARPWLRGKEEKRKPIVCVQEPERAC